MEEQHRICQTCGVSLSPDSKFCGKCGYAVEPMLRTEESELAVRRNLTYSSEFVSLLKKAAWSKILLVAYVASALIEVATGSVISNTQSIVDLSSAINLFCFFGLIITFLMWLHRASSNLASLGYINQRFSPGWAVGWWFIPFMNILRPFEPISLFHNVSATLGELVSTNGYASPFGNNHLLSIHVCGRLIRQLHNHLQGSRFA